MADIGVEALRFLASEAGRDAYDLALTIDAPLLNRVEKLRKRFSPEIADALVTLMELREKGRAKFQLADKMFFTKESLQQASDQIIAAYRAERFARAQFHKVGDLCCGIGGDTIQLARVCHHVTAMDKNPLMTEMARLNVAAHGLGRKVSFQLADLERNTKLPDFEAVFIDPSRRVEGKRVLSLADSEPSIAIVNRALETTPNVAVKCAPALKVEDFDFGCPVGVEFFSDEGSCKECVLWFGDFAFDGIRATLLPEGRAFSSNSARQGASPLNDLGGAQSEAPIVEPMTYLYEPDNAIIAAGLVEPLAAELGLNKISDAIAYLTSRTLVLSPFLDAFRVIAFMPLNVKQINRFLRDHRVSRLTIKRRGCPMEPDDLQKRLKLSKPASKSTLGSDSTQSANKLRGPAASGVFPGRDKKHVFLLMTRIREKPSVVICDRYERDQPDDEKP